MKHEPTLTEELQKEIKELKENISDIKETVIRQVAKSKDRIPEAIHAGEERVVQTVEAHPFSSLGWAAAAGFILGAFFTNKVK